MIIKRLFKWLSRLVITYRGQGKGIYLTFDDGPHPQNTVKILDVLEQYNVQATFFMVGEQIQENPQIAKEIVKRGHSIGYHSFSHVHINELTVQEFLFDLKQAKQLEKKYELNFRKLYRPPYGGLSIISCFILLVCRWQIIFWSRDSMDSYESSSSVFKNLTIEKIEMGDIILLHDDYSKTIKTVEKLLFHYKENNIRCLTLVNQL